MSDRPRICVDLTANETFDRHGGIGKYAYYLAEGLAQVQADAADVELCALRHSGGPVIPLEQALNDRGLDEPLLDMSVYKRRRRWFMGGVLRRAQVSLFHATQPAALPLVKGGVRIISTIHDLIPLVFPPEGGGAFERRSQHVRNVARWRSRTRGADRIIAISDVTANDLHERLNVSRERVSVVHHGVDASRFSSAGDTPQAIRTRFALPARGFVSVGSDHYRKNQRRLFEAWLACADEIPDGLVFVGRTLYQESLQELFAEVDARGLSGRVLWLDDVSDADLPALYRWARAAFCPSLYEGFGMTVLEAMACGTAVAATANGVYGEVAGDNALYFDGQSTSNMADCMRRLSSDDALVESLSERGLAHASAFTWRRCAQQTLAAYRSALR